MLQVVEGYQYQFGHGFRLEFGVDGNGWGIPTLNTANVEVLWLGPRKTIRRLSTSNDVTVVKAAGNNLVTIGVLVKPGDHDVPGKYQLQAFDLTNAARVPAPLVTYIVLASLVLSP